MPKPNLYELYENLKPIVQGIAQGSYSQKMSIEESRNGHLGEKEQLLAIYKYITSIEAGVLKMHGLLRDYVELGNEYIESYIHGSNKSDQIEEDPF